MRSGAVHSSFLWSEVGAALYKNLSLSYVNVLEVEMKLSIICHYIKQPPHLSRSALALHFSCIARMEVISKP